MSLDVDPKSPVSEVRRVLLQVRACAEGARRAWAPGPAGGTRNAANCHAKCLPHRLQHAGELNCDVTSSRLLYHGRFLEDAETLESLGIQSGHTILVVPKSTSVSAAKAGCERTRRNRRGTASRYVRATKTASHPPFSPMCSPWPQASP